MEKHLNNLNALAGKISPHNSPESEKASKTMSSPLTQPDQPDHDAIKMFVGQIPRSWDENDLRKMFEDFGKVYQINVLRDKTTGQSKGCCFVTFYARKSALDAQNALHNIRSLPGMHHPIQMKPADTENRNERKLFVGMLSKKCSESDVRVMFSPYGQIEECTVLRDANGASKGCAFVTYASRQCAISAIKTMHQSQTMEGCSAPLVVKFADTQKDKDQKRLQTMASNLYNLQGLGLSTIPGLSPQFLAVSTGDYTQLAAANQGNIQALSNIQQLGGAVGVQQLLAASQGLFSNGSGIQNLATLQTSPSSLSLTNSTSNTSEMTNNLQSLAALANLSATNPNLTPVNIQNLATLAAVTGGGSASGLPSITPAGSSNSGLSSPALSGLASSTAGTLSTPMTSTSPVTTSGSAINGIGTTNGTSLDALTSAYSGIQPYTAFPSAFNQVTLATNQPATGRQLEGPEGANLFIYHLPQEFTDSDLAQTFTPFGNVLSAKVFIDKQTNLSKCFGFVSYDNPVNAQAAIQAMNGFQIGTKRLKVQLKRSKDASKPY